MTAAQGRRRWLGEVPLLAGLLVVALVVRRPRFMLTQPLWLDEGWVAGSVRAPLGMLGRVTSSTPIGWTLLLRLVPDAGIPERLRLVPLAFGVATVVPAYLLGRLVSGRLGRRHAARFEDSIARRPVFGAVICGLAAALAPAVVARHDLKQYTAEAFAVLTLLLMLAWLEAWWSPRRLFAFSGVCILGALISQSMLLVAAAAFAGLGVTAVLGRSTRRLAAVVAAGLVVVVADGLLYLVFAAPSNTPLMTAWWRTSFIPVDQGMDTAVAVVAQRTIAELGRGGFGPWSLVLALVVAGIALLWRRGLRAAALIAPIVYAELLVAGSAGMYPFLDDRAGLRWTVRSSTFFSVLLTVMAALGVVAVVAAAGRLRPSFPFRRAAVLLTSSAVVVAAVGLLVPASASAARTSIPPAARPVMYEDTRSQVRYVLRHRRPGDVVVVSTLAIFSFAAYWPDTPTTVRSVPSDPVRFRFTYPQRRDIVIAESTDPALEAAARRAGRLWIVRVHLRSKDVTRWQRAVRRLGRVTSPVPGLLLVRPYRPDRLPT
jgi:hypothetical protein